MPFLVFIFPLLVLFGCQTQSYKSVEARTPAVAGPTSKQVDKDMRPAVGILSIDGTNSCSGTLIGKNIFLTAQHCVAGTNRKYIVSFPNSSTETGLFDVTEIKIPDRYSYYTAADTGDDVALLKLSRSPKIHVMNLYNKTISSLIPSTFATALGYGKTTDSSEMSGALMQGQLRLNGFRTKTGVGVNQGASLLFRANPDYIRGGDSGGPIVLSSVLEDSVIGVTSGPATNGNPEMDINFEYAGTEVLWLRDSIKDLVSGIKRPITSAFLGVDSTGFLDPDYYDPKIILPLTSFWNITFKESKTIHQCRLVGHYSTASFYEIESLSKTSKVFLDLSVPCERTRDNALLLSRDEVVKFLKEAPTYSGRIRNYDGTETQIDHSINLVFSLFPSSNVEQKPLRQSHCGYKSVEENVFNKLNVDYGHTCSHLRSSN